MIFIPQHKRQPTFSKDRVTRGHLAIRSLLQPVSAYCSVKVAPEKTQDPGMSVSNKTLFAKAGNGLKRFATPAPVKHPYDQFAISIRAQTPGQSDVKLKGYTVSHLYPVRDRTPQR